MPNSPAIDPNEIRIEAVETTYPDTKYEFVLPTKCVQQITDRLDEQKQKMEGPRLYDLLAHICYEEAVSRFDLEPIWQFTIPPMKKPLALEPGDDFIFFGIIDSPQEITWPDFSTLNIERPLMEISEALVNAELEEQCLDAGKQIPSTKPLASGDEATGHAWLGSVDTNEVFIDKDAISVRIPAKGQPALVEGIPIANLAEALQGSVAGDQIEVDFEVSGFEGMPELTGSTLTCRFDIKETHHIEPTTVEEVVALYGSPSEAGLRQQIYHSLELRFQREQMVWVNENVLAQVESLVDITIPIRIIEDDVRRQQEMYAKSLSEAGLDGDEIKSKINASIDVYKSRSLQRTRRHAINVLLQRHFKIKVDERDLLAHIQLLADMRGESPEIVRKELVESELINQVATKCTECKIVEHILSVANVTDARVDPGSFSFGGLES